MELATRLGMLKSQKSEGLNEEMRSRQDDLTVRYPLKICLARLLDAFGFR
jgi:hypothetical protein